jgi:hypothetical protein
MPKNRVFEMKFAKVYPLYVQKAERKNRTKEETCRAGIHIENPFPIPIAATVRVCGKAGIMARHAVNAFFGRRCAKLWKNKKQRAKRWTKTQMNLTFLA